MSLVNFEDYRIQKQYEDFYFLRLIDITKDSNSLHNHKSKDGFTRTYNAAWIRMLTEVINKN